MRDAVVAAREAGLEESGLLALLRRRVGLMGGGRFLDLLFEGRLGHRRGRDQVGGRKRLTRAFAATISRQKFWGLDYSTRRRMFRTRLALVALLGAALVFVASASAAVPTLTGTDGPGFTITLKKGKTKVTSLKAGKYKIVVKDLSNIHNFHLTWARDQQEDGRRPQGDLHVDGHAQEGHLQVRL